MVSLDLNRITLKNNMVYFGAGDIPERKKKRDYTGLIIMLVFIVACLGNFKLGMMTADKSYDRGYADGQANPITIMEYCIKEETVDTGTVFFTYGSTTAVFIEDEQGVHVVKMCDNI